WTPLSEIRANRLGKPISRVGIECRPSARGHSGGGSRQGASDVDANRVVAVEGFRDDRVGPEHRNAAAGVCSRTWAHVRPGAVNGGGDHLRVLPLTLACRITLCV